MGGYEAPAVLATYSVDELVEEAANCETYQVTTTFASDSQLKDDVAEICRALDGIKSIRTN
jgi:hypothetical protein